MGRAFFPRLAFLLALAIARRPRGIRAAHADGAGCVGCALVMEAAFEKVAAFASEEGNHMVRRNPHTLRGFRGFTSIQSVLLPPRHTLSQSHLSHFADPNVYLAGSAPFQRGSQAAARKKIRHVHFSQEVLELKVVQNACCERCVHRVTQVKFSTVPSPFRKYEMPTAVSCVLFSVLLHFLLVFAFVLFHTCLAPFFFTPLLVSELNGTGDKAGGLCEAV